MAAFLVHAECCAASKQAAAGGLHLTALLKVANNTCTQSKLTLIQRFVHIQHYYAMSGSAATSTLGWLDLGMFGAMLGVSALIGVYFALTSKQDSAKEYLMGGKNMGMFPVSISLIARFVKNHCYIYQDKISLPS